MTARSLIANVSWSLTGNLTTGVSQWATLLLLTRLGNVELAGQYAQGLAICLPVISAAGLQMSSLQASDMRGAHRFEDYLTLRLLTMVAAAGAIVWFARSLPAQGEIVWITLLLGAGKLLDGIADVFFGLMQQRERNDRMAQSQALRSLGSLLLISILVALTGSLTWACVGAAVWSAAVLWLFDVPQSARLLKRDGLQAIRLRWRPAALLSLAWLLAPVGLVSGLAALQISVPRLIIQANLGTESLGVYAGLAASAFTILALLRSLNQSVIPRLARYIASENWKELRSLLLKLELTYLSAGAAVLLLFLGVRDAALRIVLGPDFAPYGSVFLFLVAAVVVRLAANPLNAVLRAQRRFWTLCTVYGAGLAVIAAASAHWVPRAGLEGAAWGFLAGTVVEAALLIGLAAAIFPRPQTTRNAAPLAAAEKPLLIGEI